MVDTEKTLKRLIKQLDLCPHPEGGWYRQTFVSDDVIPGSATGNRKRPRPLLTSIYFLITAGNYSAFHRIRSDEIWYHHSGTPVQIEVIHPDGQAESLLIGSAEQGYHPQVCIKGGCWFASHTANNGLWALTGCAVAPGFDFEDFELADRRSLSSEFPQHESIIKAYTRSESPLP